MSGFDGQGQKRILASDCLRQLPAGPGVFARDRKGTSRILVALDVRSPLPAVWEVVLDEKQSRQSSRSAWIGGRQLRTSVEREIRSYSSGWVDLGPIEPQEIPPAHSDIVEQAVATRALFSTHAACER